MLPLVVTVRPLEDMPKVAPERPIVIAPALLVPILICDVPEVEVPLSMVMLPAVLVVPVALPVAMLTLLELVDAVEVAAVLMVVPANP